jgi:hypothetical protein
MANKYMKKYSTPIHIKEMQVRTAVRFHLTQSEWLSSKKETTNVGEDAGRKGNTQNTAGRDVN